MEIKRSNYCCCNEQFPCKATVNAIVPSSPPRFAFEMFLFLSSKCQAANSALEVKMIVRRGCLLTVSLAMEGQRPGIKNRASYFEFTICCNVSNLGWGDEGPLQHDLKMPPCVNYRTKALEKKDE